MAERNVVSSSWVVTVKIVRTDSVVYGDMRSVRSEQPSPFREETEEIDCNITQDSIAGAVGVAIAMLEIRSPQSERAEGLNADLR